MALADACTFAMSAECLCFCVLRLQASLTLGLPLRTFDYGARRCSHLRSGCLIATPAIRNSSFRNSPFRNSLAVFVKILLQKPERVCPLD